MKRSAVKTWVFGLGLVWGLVTALPAGAAESDEARALTDMRVAYETRLAALEAEVAQLRGDKVVVAPALPPGTGTPRLSIQGFGSMQYDTRRNRPRTSGLDTTTTNHNTVGPIVLFLSSQISEDFSFFSEVEWDFSDDGVGKIDIERAMLKYDYASWLKVGWGRGHTALGYWNQRFHHGTWFQTTAERPLIYAFPGDGGLLPIHFTGFELNGNVELGEGQISYYANFANGRGNRVGQVQMKHDRNDQKMLSLMSTWHPAEDTGIGFSVVSDRLPGDASNPLRTHRIDEMIYGAHAYYEILPWELIGEAFVIDHDDHTVNQDFNHFGGYLQLAYALGRWKPYYRYDFLNMENGDPFYTDPVTGGPRFRAEDTTQHTAGIRWDLRDFLALKAEYRHLVGDSEREDAATVQASFAF